MKVDSLAAYKGKRTFEAQPGRDGRDNKRHGRAGSDIEIQVPMGTQVWGVRLVGMSSGNDSPSLLVDLTNDGESLIIAVGGEGGRGNAAFVTSILREPLLAEDGEYGEERTLRLEVKLLTDVAIIGLSNVGKSSLLAALSHARPKVADYPFTTLEPMLGVVERDTATLVAVDVPALVEGAHEGVGLGYDFLRHTQRTRLLVHVIDGLHPDVVGQMRIVNDELRRFDERLARKSQIVVVNKLDVSEVANRQDEMHEDLRLAVAMGTDVFFVSVKNRLGIDQLAAAMFRKLDEAGPERVAMNAKCVADEIRVLRPLAQTGGSELAIRDGEVFRVTHVRAVRLARGSDLTSWSARVQMRDQLRRMGITRRLEELGVSTGDRILVGEWEFTWE